MPEDLAQGLQRGPGIGQHLHAIEFQGIARADVEVEKLHLRVLKQGFRRGGEVGIAGADADDQIGLRGQQVGGQATGLADPADVQRVRRDNRAFAGLGFGERNIKALGKGLQGCVGRGVLDPAPADDQRLAFTRNDGLGVGQHRRGRQATVDAVHAFLQEVIRVIVGFGLNVLWQGQGDGAGFSRVGEHAHGLDGRAHQLLGTVDAIPVFTHGLECIVGADAQVVELLDLLQYRVRLTAGIDIARQQQQRDPVGGGSGRGGEHIGSPGADRRGAGVNLASQVLLGEADRGMGHALLVAALMHHQIAAVLLQRLAQPQHVAVTKNGENPGDKLALDPIDFDVLVIEKFHQGLGHGQSCRTHVFTLKKYLSRLLAARCRSKLAPAGQVGVVGLAIWPSAC